jgi:hypothetical protein
MREVNKIAEGLFEKIRDRFEDVSLGDENAKATSDPELARFFNFDYTVDGENHGNITMSLIDETSLKVYFSKNITDELDEHQKKHWYHFLRELREFAKRNLLSFEPRDITRSTLKHRDIAQQSKADATFDKDEVIGESKLYGTSKSSYQKFGPARIIVRHNAPVVDEATGARSRHINSIYVENSEGERFKMPFKSLTGARAMARHVSAGGSPHDDLGRHICEMAQECATLKPFMNNVRRRTFEDAETATMVEAAFEYHGLLNNTLKRMSGKKGYTRCKEQFVATSTSYIPEDEANLDEMKERFIKRVFNEKMTDALPLVYKAYDMKKNNKFTEQFENWANTIAEGTWAFPDTEEDKQKLIDLLSQELPVGVDAQNATNALYDVFGDDKLFDALEELAQVDPKADARDTVMDHLADKNPNLYQAIVDQLGDPDTPEPTEAGDEEVAESYTPPPVVINGKQVDLASIELDGVESWDRPDYADAYADYAEFTDGTPLSEQELEELTDKHGDIINMKAHDMLESVADDASENNAEPGKFSKTYGSGDGGMDGVVYEDEEDDSVEAIQSAIIRRIINGKHHELLMKLGPAGVSEAVADLAYRVGPVDEIGTSDVSIWVRELERDAGVEHEYSDLHEAFERALNESAINVGDIIRDKTQPEISGKVVGDMEENYTIQVEGELYHIKKLNAEVVQKAKTSLEEATDLQSLVGQEVYVPGAGTTGTVAGIADPNKFSNSLIVRLKNGSQTVVHFKDVQATKPGIVKQILDKLNALTGGGTAPKYQPKPYGQVSDLNTPQQFQKLAGLK